MSPKQERRTRAICDKAEMLLPNKSYGVKHNFFLSHNEATTIGQAVAERDQRTLNAILEYPVGQLEQHYDTLEIADLRDEWNKEISRVLCVDTTLEEVIDSKQYSGDLEDVLAGRIENQTINLGSASYVKLLETIAYATAPERQGEFDPRYTSSAKFRKGSNRLPSRALTILDRLADEQPGLRTIRENLLEEDETALNRYLQSLSLSRLAAKSLGRLIEQYESGNADVMRQHVRSELAAPDAYDELSITHILTWDILPPEITDSPQRDDYIMQHILNQTTTETQREKVRKDWNKERIDVLFDTAAMALQNDRDPKIYISATFDGGAGLYLAVEMNHPLDKAKKIVIADNPIEGNALYFVDEQLTNFDESDQQYGWRDVLGVFRRVARERGARRRYHTGNWSELPMAICEYGGDFEAATKLREAHDDIKEETPSSQSTSRKQTRDELFRAADAAIARARELLQ